LTAVVGWRVVGEAGEAAAAMVEVSSIYHGAKHGFIRGGGCAKSFRDPPKHYVLFPKIPIKRRKKLNEAEIVVCTWSLVS
jgi:hypothetical protein